MAEEDKKSAYEFSIAGFKLKLNSAFLAMAIPIATTLGGGLWGAFEFYQDYVGMKKKIAAYISPDLSEFDKRLAVIEENSTKTTDYTRDIKNDLKSDIRRTETVAEQIERSMKQTQRELDQDFKSVQKDIRASLDRSREDMEKLKRDTDARLDRVVRDTDNKVERLSKSVDDKIKTAIDNPLAGK